MKKISKIKIMNLAKKIIMKFKKNKINKKILKSNNNKKICFVDLT
jgi:hypothetical protein